MDRLSRSSGRSSYDYILSFSNLACSYVRRHYSSPVRVKECISHINLPEKNETNTTRELYAKQLLFIAAIHDIKYVGRNGSSLENVDYIAYLDMKHTMIDLLKTCYNPSTSDAYRYYLQRDLIPNINKITLRLLAQE